MRSIDPQTRDFLEGLFVAALLSLPFWGLVVLLFCL